MRISASAVTQLTDQLLRKALIKRRAAIDDRRCVMAALPTKGERFTNQFWQRQCDILNGALAHLSDAEKARVAQALDKVVETLEKYGINSAGEGLSRKPLS